MGAEEGKIYRLTKGTKSAYGSFEEEPEWTRRGGASGRCCKDERWASKKVRGGDREGNGGDEGMGEGGDHADESRVHWGRGLGLGRSEVDRLANVMQEGGGSLKSENGEEWDNRVR